MAADCAKCEVVRRGWICKLDNNTCEDKGGFSLSKEATGGSDGEKKEKEST